MCSWRRLTCALSCFFQQFLSCERGTQHISSSRLRHKSISNTVHLLCAFFIMVAERLFGWATGRESRWRETDCCFRDDRSYRCANATRSGRWLQSPTTDILGSETTTGPCGRRGSERTQSWLDGLRYWRWQKRKRRQSRWWVHQLRRFGWARSFTRSCWQRLMVRLSASYILRRGEQEQRREAYFTRSMQDRLVPGRETWYERWYAQGISGWPMRALLRTSWRRWLSGRSRLQLTR